MLDQNAFLKRMGELEDYAELNGNVLTKTEVEECFDGLELSEEQKEFVYHYLFEKKIRIHGVMENMTGENGQEETNVSWDEEIAEADENTSEEDSRYLKMYMEELEELPKLTEGERLAMAVRLLAGEKEAYSELLNATLTQVVELAREYQGRGILLSDLIQEGNIGLMEVLQELCGKGKQEEPLDYIREYIQYSIAQYIDEQTMEEDDEERVVAKFALLHEAAKHMGEENGVLPTVKELSEYTRIPEEEIEELVKLVKDVDFLGGEK